MAVFKKGSKGNDVKNIQTLLNKSGVKPTLSVDGIFGPLTDKAVRDYQKKNGLKTDGKVGGFTLATLKFGGKLPEMTVGDFTKRKETYSKMWVYNRQNTLSLVNIEKQIAKFATIAAKEVPVANKVSLENYKHWEKIAVMVDEVIAKQAQFKVELIKNPKKAEKLAKDCADLDKQILAIGKGKIEPNLATAGGSMEKFNKIWRSTEEFLKKERAEIAKRAEEY